MKHILLSAILIALVISGCQSCMDQFVGSPSGDVIEETDVQWWEDEVEDVEEDVITQESILFLSSIICSLATRNYNEYL